MNNDIVIHNLTVLFSWNQNDEFYTAIQELARRISKQF